MDFYVSLKFELDMILEVKSSQMPLCRQNINVEIFQKLKIRTSINVVANEACFEKIGLKNNGQIKF